jgi:hypothetical protein
MEPEDSLPYSRESATAPYPKPDELSPQRSTLLIPLPSHSANLPHRETLHHEC